MPKKSKPGTAGEVVYVKNDNVPPVVQPTIAETPPAPTVTVEAPPPPTVTVEAPLPPPLETIAPTTLQKQKVKAPMSEAKKAHLAKLAEMNRKKREEAKARVPPTVEIPEPAGDVIRIAVRPKRNYLKKDKDFWDAITTRPEKKAEIEGIPRNEVIIPEVVELQKPQRKTRAPAPPPAPPPPPPPAPIKRPVKAFKEPVQPVKSRAPRKVKYVEPSDEETEEEDSSDEEEVERVVRKTHKRLSTLDKIDQRLRALRNPYEAYGLSAF